MTDDPHAPGDHLIRYRGDDYDLWLQANWDGALWFDLDGNHIPHRRVVAWTTLPSATQGAA